MTKVLTSAEIQTDYVVKPSNVSNRVLSRCRLMSVFEAGTHASSSDGTDLSCQRVKLVGKRPFVAALHHELTFSNHVHELDAGQDISGCPK